MVEVDSNRHGTFTAQHEWEQGLRRDGTGGVQPECGGVQKAPTASPTQEEESAG